MDRDKDELPPDRSAWQRPRFIAIPAKEAEVSFNSTHVDNTTMS